MYAETGLMYPYFHNFSQAVQQYEDFGCSQKPNASSVNNPAIVIFFFLRSANSKEKIFDLFDFLGFSYLNSAFLFLVSPFLCFCLTVFFFVSSLCMISFCGLQFLFYYSLFDCP